MTDKQWKLCYAEGDIDEVRLFYTEDMEGQWGDDWNDVPYEHNAGWPYGTYEGKIRIFVLRGRYFELPYGGYYNSPFSVRNINGGSVPWLVCDESGLDAGTTVSDLIDFAKNHNILLWEEKRVL